MALGVGGNRCEARNEPFRRSGAPIAGNKSPHHNTLAEFASGWNDPGIAKSIRRAKPPRRRAGGRFYGEIAAAKFDGDAVWFQPKQIGMSIRVIADDMAAGGGFSEQFGAVARMLANHEERGASLETIEKIEQLGGDRGIRPVVEGERELARRIGAADGRAKKLRTRVNGSVRYNTGSRGGQDGRGGNEPRVHRQDSPTFRV